MTDREKFNALVILVERILSALEEAAGQLGKPYGMYRSDSGWRELTGRLRQELEALVVEPDDEETAPTPPPAP